MHRACFEISSFWKHVNAGSEQHCSSEQSWWLPAQAPQDGSAHQSNGGTCKELDARVTRAGRERAAVLSAAPVPPPRPAVPAVLCTDAK